MSAQKTLLDVLEDHALRRPDQTALTFLIDGDALEISLSYAQLVQRAQGVAAGLLSRGLHGSRVILLHPPGPEFVVAFLGCLFVGVTAVPVYPPDPARLGRTLPRLVKIIADAEPRAILTTEHFLVLAQHLVAQAPELAHHELLASDLLENQGGAWTRPAVSVETLAFLQYTSGSTGLPRGVCLSQGNLMHNLHAIQCGFGHTESSKAMIWLPPYHDMGLIGGILQPLYAGFPLVLMSPQSFLARPALWLRAISRHRATTSGGPNFAYELCVRRISDSELDELDLRSWQVAFIGAEPTRADTLLRFADKFARCGFRWSSFFPCYGLAESTLYVSGGRLPPPATIAQKTVTCGRIAVDTQAILVDPETRHPVVEDGQVGELWLRSDSVASGYFRRADESAQTFGARLASGDGPFLRTGDLAFLHGDELFVKSRLKDVIKIRGLQHAPQEIEQTVERSHPAIRAGGIAAFSILVDGEESLAIAAETTSSELDAHQLVPTLRAAVAEQHGLSVKAVALLPAGSIPKTTSGKIRRSACKDALVAGTLGAWHSFRERPADAASEPAAGPYSDLRETCAEIDRRKTRYRFDLERDLPWERIGEPGCYFPDAYLALFGVDATLLRERGAYELFQWALALGSCEDFIYLEENLVGFAEKERSLLGPTRSLDLLCEEEGKHTEMFRRYSRWLAAQRPDAAERLLSAIRRDEQAPRWEGGKRPSDAAHHYIFWLHILFFEEYSIYFHRVLKEASGIQPLWLATHAAHRQEEIQHVVTDFVYLQSLRLPEHERRFWSAVFLDRSAADLDRVGNLRSVLDFCIAEVPALREVAPALLAFSQDKLPRERALLRLLTTEDGFERTVRSAIAYPLFAARPELNPGTAAHRTAATPSPQAQAAAARRLERFLKEFCARTLAVSPEDLSAQRLLSEYGMDSVAVVELAQALSSELGFPVTPMHIWHHPSIAELARSLSASAAARTAPIG